MENYKNEKREKVIHDFSKYPELALQLLEDEKKARERMRRRAKLGIKTIIPKEIDDVIKEAELA